MFPKENRLTLKKDILKTKKGESAKGAFFVVRTIKNNLGIPRVSVSVGKKVSLKSVDRNLIKRRTIEAARLVLENNESFDVYIIALTDSKKASYSQIESEIKNLLKRTKVINA